MARDLTSGAVGPLLVTFALPTLAASAIQSASGTFNAFWVGRYLDEGALAATANGNIAMFLLVSFVFGFGMAATIYVGQAFGKNDSDRARQVLGTALGAFVPAALLVAVLAWLGAPAALSLLDTDAAIAADARQYLRAILSGMPFMLTLTLLTMALRGAGDAITPLVFTGLCVVLDVSLTPLLIAGLWGLPELGMTGAGLATAIANFLALSALVATLYLRRSPLAIRSLVLFIPDPATLRLVLGKGLPMGLQMIVVSGAALTILGLVNGYGVDAAAAYGIVQQIWTYLQMPGMALSAAVSAIAAQNIGAGKWARVGEVTAKGVVAAAALTGLVLAALLLADTPVLGLFLDREGSAETIAERILWVGSGGYVALGMAFVYIGTIRANGQVWAPLLIIFAGMFPIRVSFALLFQDTLGLDAIWWSFPVSMVAILAMAYAYYRFSGWRTGDSWKLRSHHEGHVESRTLREPGAQDVAIA